MKCDDWFHNCALGGHWDIIIEFHQMTTRYLVIIFTCYILVQCLEGHDQFLLADWKDWLWISRQSRQIHDDLIKRMLRIIKHTVFIILLIPQWSSIIAWCIRILQGDISSFGSLFDSKYLLGFCLPSLLSSAMWLLGAKYLSKLSTSWQ